MFPRLSYKPEWYETDDFVTRSERLLRSFTYGTPRPGAPVNLNFKPKRRAPLVARMWRKYGRVSRQLGHPQAVLIQECVQRPGIYKIFTAERASSRNEGAALLTCIFHPLSGDDADEIYVDKYHEQPPIIEEFRWVPLPGGTRREDPEEDWWPPAPLRADEFSFITSSSEIEGGR